MSSPPYRTLAGCALLLLSACVTPRVPSVPLAPPDALERALATRTSLAPTGALGRDEAVALLRRHNPRVRSARAELAARRAVERAGTAAPNPTIALGPLLSGGSDVLSAGAWGLEAALGWTSFLVNTRAVAQGLKQVLVHEAFVEAAATEREELLALRGDVIRLAGARANVALQERQIERGTQEGVQLDAAARAGGIEPIDADLAALQVTRIGAELAAARVVESTLRADLGGRLGIAPEAVPAVALDTSRTPTRELPPRETLYALAERSHPDLDRIRAAYLVAEKEMRLAVAEGVPQLDLSASYEREDGDTLLGFPLSIEVPLFDRNQVEITRANGRRCSLRQAYDARLTAVLAEIDGARLRLIQRIARARALEGPAAERVDRAVKAARDGLAAGTIDGLRYVEVMRAVREIRLEVLESRSHVFEAWYELERAVGAPLLALDGWDPSEESK